MKVFFVVPQLSQPRCIKRVQVFYEKGFEVEVCGFDNGLYSENIKSYPCKVNKFAVEGRKSKLRSIQKNISLIRYVVKMLQKDDMVYVFGIELAAYFILLSKKNIFFYEQADLNYTKLKSSFLVSFFKGFDKYLIRRSYKTILTSQGFIDYLYDNHDAPANIVLLENRLNNELKTLNVVRHSYNLESIRFAFVGAVRYPRTILGFAKVIATRFPQHQFHFYGEGHSSSMAKALCDEYPDNLFYHGGFSNPKDLPQIYYEVDVNVVCYDPASMNVKIAEPNKLYESIYFKVPLVVSSGTFLERKVTKMRVGFGVDCTDNASIETFIRSLTKERIEACQNAMNLIPNEDLFDNTLELIETISNDLGVLCRN